MSPLPAGWEVKALADIASKPQYGWTSAAAKDVDGPRMLRTTDITHGPIHWASVPGALSPPLDEAKFELADGDIVISRAGSVGFSALIRKPPLPAIFASYLMRLRPHPSVHPPYLAAFLKSDQYWRQVSSVTDGIAIPNINASKLSNVLVPVPPPDEQRRIVDILEDHLSRLDAATSGLDAGRRRARVLTKSILLELIPNVDAYPDVWRLSSVGDAGRVELGRQRHPDWHHGDTMRPYLRVANVFENRIDVRDVKEMHWPAATFERFRLQQGDILLNEGQSPELLGRPAMYRGELGEVAFTNSLIRFTAHVEVLPEFALLVFRRHMHAGRFMRESRITTNIAHLSASRLKSVEFPVPPLLEQQRMVTVAAERLAAVVRLLVEIDAMKERLSGLRRSLLGAAFSGRLTGHSSDLDRARSW
jgi:type I restriction enzyme S subunit